MYSPKGQQISSQLVINTVRSTYSKLRTMPEAWFGAFEINVLNACTIMWPEGPMYGPKGQQIHFELVINTVRSTYSKLRTLPKAGFGGFEGLSQSPRSCCKIITIWWSKVLFKRSNRLRLRFLNILFCFDLCQLCF